MPSLGRWRSTLGQLQGSWRGAYNCPRRPAPAAANTRRAAAPTLDNCDAVDGPQQQVLLVLRVLRLAWLKLQLLQLLLLHQVANQGAHLWHGGFYTWNVTGGGWAGVKCEGVLSAAFKRNP